MKFIPIAFRKKIKFRRIGNDGNRVKDGNKKRFGNSMKKGNSFLPSCEKQALLDT